MCIDIARVLRTRKVPSASDSNLGLPKALNMLIFNVNQVFHFPFSEKCWLCTCIMTPVFLPTSFALR